MIGTDSKSLAFAAGIGKLRHAKKQWGKTVSTIDGGETTVIITVTPQEIRCIEMKSLVLTSSSATPGKNRLPGKIVGGVAAGTTQMPDLPDAQAHEVPVPPKPPTMFGGQFHTYTGNNRLAWDVQNVWFRGEAVFTFTIPTSVTVPPINSYNYHMNPYVWPVSSLLGVSPEFTTTVQNGDGTTSTISSFYAYYIVSDAYHQDIQSGVNNKYRSVPDKTDPGWIPSATIFPYVCTDFFEQSEPGGAFNLVSQTLTPTPGVRSTRHANFWGGTAFLQLGNMQRLIFEGTSAIGVGLFTVHSMLGSPSMLTSFGVWTFYRRLAFASFVSTPPEPANWHGWDEQHAYRIIAAGESVTITPVNEVQKVTATEQGIPVRYKDAATTIYALGTGRFLTAGWRLATIVYAPPRNP